MYKLTKKLKLGISELINTKVHVYKGCEQLSNYIYDEILPLPEQNKLMIQLFLISTDEEYIKEIQSTLNRLLPDAHIIGATTDGSVVYKEDVNVTTISFTIFEKSKLQHTFIPFELTKEDECGQTIAQNILSEKTKVLILFADGLQCNASKLTQTIHSLYPNLIVAGGLAGDNARLEKTIVCDNTLQGTQAVVALSIESDSLYVHNDYTLAWETVGKKMQITKCHENIIYEINGLKASHIYDKYTNTRYLDHYKSSKNQPTISIEFPLIIERNNMNIARVTMKVNEDGSLFCTGDFVEGDTLSFSFTDTTKIIKSGVELSRRILKVPVQTIFIYSCMARRRFMGENIIHDLEPLQKIAPVSGFYSYGEFYTTSQSIEMFNHTMTVLTLSEEDEIYTHKIHEPAPMYSKSAQTLNVLSSLISTSKNPIPEANALQYQAKTKELYLNAQKIKMSKSETKLFDLLFHNTDAAIDSQTIFSHVFEDTDKEFNTNAIRSLVKKLRKKLPVNSIENLYGGYYRLIK